MVSKTRFDFMKILQILTLSARNCESYWILKHFISLFSHFTGVAEEIQDTGSY